MAKENRSGERRTRFSEQRMHIFKDEYFDSQFLRALTHQTYGGAAVRECFWAASQIRDGDFESWTRAWQELAARVKAMAEGSLASSHPVSAREAFLRASNYYRCAEFLISPGIPLHREVWEKSRECFQNAGSLFDPPIEPISVASQGYRLPGYFVPAAEGCERRPTVIVFGGGDSSGEELYFYMGEGARRRGYHTLLVEGPGQRGALHANPGLVFRYDYEVPLKAVVDYAVSRPEVDQDRLALYRLSLGGYIAVRSAAFEGRIKACIANPTYLDFSLAMRKGLPGWIQCLPPGIMDSVLNAVAKVSPMVRFALGVC